MKNVSLGILICSDEECEYVFQFVVMKNVSLCNGQCCELGHLVSSRAIWTSCSFLRKYQINHNCENCPTLHDVLLVV